MANRKVVVIVGSLRKGSFSRMMAKAMCGPAPGLDCEILEIGNLPLYNQDLDEGNPPKEWAEFRQRLRAADAVLFVTPEYNRSVPGALKNAVDVASRPYGKSAWNGKPAGVMSVSPGAIGGFAANHALRQSFVFLNMPCMPQPEAYVGGAATLFDEQGRIKVDGTRTFLRQFVEAFAAWVEVHKAA